MMKNVLSPFAHVHLRRQPVCALYFDINRQLCDPSFSGSFFACVSFMLSVSNPMSLPWQVILLLIMLVMRKRVGLTIALFNVAGKVFIHLPLLVFQPFWTFFALLLFWVYWVMVLLFLGTTGMPV